MKSPDVQADVQEAGPQDRTDYESWVRSQASAAEDLSAALFIERPVDGLTEIIREAGGEKVRRFICGFLPDELDWPRPGVDGWLALLVGRHEFVPRLLALTGESPDVRGGVLLYESDETAGRASWTALATGLAAATRENLHQVCVAGRSPQAIAGFIESARWIFNDVNDWSLGFAIDEYAARLGRSVVRLRNPGYSPLRYAVLGIALPPTVPVATNVPRLRPVLGPLVGNLQRAPEAAFDDSWFTPFVGAQKWRAFFELQHFYDFWKDMDWTRLAPMPSVGAGQWLDRSFAWSALVRAADPGRFPAEGYARALATMTTWLVEQQRAQNIERGREAALPRWVRYHPEWIDDYVTEWGGQRGTTAMTRWVERGLAWHQPSVPAIPVLQASDSVFSAATGIGEHLQLARAWWRNWSDVPGLVVPGSVLSPAWQQACLEAFESAIAPGDAGAGDTTVFWRDSEIWKSCFGPRYAAAYAAGAVGCGRRSDLRATLRPHLAPVHQRGAGQVLRLIRAGFPALADFFGWIRQQSPAEPIRWERVVVQAALNWHRLHGRRLWCVQPDPADMRILECLLRCVPALEGGVPPSMPQGVWLPLCALGGRVETVRGIMATAARDDRSLAESMGVTASAFWIRGRENEARALLAEWSHQPDDTSRMLFIRAVACQLVGMLPEAAAALAMLREKSPRFFEEGVPDAFWEWLAVVFLRADRAADAAAFHAQAIAMSRGTVYNTVGLSPSGPALATGWAELAAGAHAVLRRGPTEG